MVDDIEKKNRVMLIFSLVFYAWGGPKYLLLLLAEVFISWKFAKLIDSEYEDGGVNSKRKAQLYLTFDVVLMLGLLVTFKYLGFFTAITSALFKFPSDPIRLALPIGISFYTFQLISYVVDVYRKEVRSQGSYYKLLLYASLFHQCIAGPIVRYKTVSEDIDSRTVSGKDISYGIRRFSRGLAKKAVLANGCAYVADQLLPNGAKELSQIPSFGIFAGLVFYSLQIFLDFSAYSDMAIGMGRMIGFHYLENFNYPYISKSIKEFWSRWHISLGTFFRDYVYIPLGGSRRSDSRNIINLLVVWALTGFWHGASANFIVWGLWFFVFLLFERKVLKDKLSSTFGIISHLYTLVVVFIGWIFFRCTDFFDSFVILKGLVGLNKSGFLNLGTWIIIKNNVFLLLMAILSSTPFFRYVRLIFTRSRFKTLVKLYDVLSPVLFLFVSLFALIGDSYNPFLYFRF